MLLLLPRNAKRQKKNHLLFCTRSTRKKKKKSESRECVRAPLIFWDETRTKIQCIRIQQIIFFLFSIQFTLYHVAGIQNKKMKEEKKKTFSLSYFCDIDLQFTFTHPRGGFHFEKLWLWTQMTYFESGKKKKRPLKKLQQQQQQHWKVHSCI